MPVINLKLPEELHIRFHEAAREGGNTMQLILSAFVSAYVEDPEKYKIKMEVSNNGSKSSS